MPEIRDIANAIKDDLNAQTFSLPFVSTVAYAPEHDLKELATLRVTIVPAGLDRTPITRANAKHENRISIGIQQRVANEDAAVDALLALAEEIRDYLDDKKQAGASIVTVTHEPLVDAEGLITKSIFTSIITNTYQTIA